ncbi:helix-turn-helix domain-containing protein [Lysobacter capsici]|uniref:helix-turn-helix domain-containing protein n=1 Tax=Lysobacter capsici TaxID=435897 RepID=UPI00071643F9|nr:helix-turn-helix transcriptional regulator [Lysobacter capsici]
MSSLYRPEVELLRKKLLAARHSAGLTQRAVAEAWGMPQETVSAVERGLRRLDVVDLMDLCQILDLDAAVVVAEVRDEAAVSRRKRPISAYPAGKPRRRS